MSDILIGAADLYTYKDVRPWMQSARESGFDGDIFLICYRIDDSVKQEAEKWNVALYEANHTPYGTEIQHQQKGSPTQAHNYRFYHAWELLTRLETLYRFVIMTDVRDVVFQKNPALFLDDDNHGQNFIIAPSEGIMYADEDWNKNNLINGFGQVFWDLIGHKWPACNVGTIAGSHLSMWSLFHAIFTMTEGRYYPSDQSSFNVLINFAFTKPTIYCHLQCGWAAQLGTTLDPTKSWLWERCNEGKPVIKGDEVYTEDGKLFTIVHQWDRVPELNKLVREKYNI